MSDHRAIARQLAHPLRAVRDAEKITRDALAGHLSAAEWAANLKSALPAALAAMDGHDLHFPLYQRFIQRAMFDRADVLPHQTWAGVLERFNAALLEDALPVYVSGVSAAVDDVASRLDVIREGDEAALAEAIARLEAAPLRQKDIVAAMAAAPRFEAVLADIDANPPPIPQEPEPPPRDPVPGLKTRLGQVFSLLGKITEAVASSTGPTPAAEPILVARHTAPVVALRIVGDQILSRDAMGRVLTTPIGGGSSAPGTLDVPSPTMEDLDAWPPTLGPVVAMTSLGRQRVAMAGVDRGGGGWVSVGQRGSPDWEFSEEDDYPWLCAAPHPHGFIVGGSDGSIRAFDEECQPIGGAEVEETPIVGQLQADEIRIPLMRSAVRSIVALGEDAVAGLQDGRVIRVAL